MMFKVGEWNAVVAGAWNPAALTPNGVRQHLFKVAKEVPMGIELAIEEVQPPRVRHDGLVVVVATDRLIAAPEISNLANLKRAAGLLVSAVQALDQTPIRAGGVNLRFSHEDPNTLLDARRSPLDERLEEQFTLNARALKRSLVRSEGLLNFEFREENGQLALDLNFHFDSTSPAQMAAWLGKVEEFHQEAVKLLEVLGVEIGETT